MKFIRLWEKELVVLLMVGMLGWLLDGFLWDFWFPVEWFLLFGKIILAWLLILLIAIVVVRLQQKDKIETK